MEFVNVLLEANAGLQLNAVLQLIESTDDRIHECSVCFKIDAFLQTECFADIKLPIDFPVEGKTTFLKLIAGDVDLAKRDSDEDIFIAKSGNPEIGYLKQMAFSDLSLTMEQEIRKAFHKIETMKAQLEELTVLMEHNHEEETIRRFTRLQENFENLGGYFYEKEYEMLIVKFGFS